MKISQLFEGKDSSIRKTFEKLKFGKTLSVGAEENESVKEYLEAYKRGKNMNICETVTAVISGDRMVTVCKKCKKQLKTLDDLFKECKIK